MVDEALVGRLAERMDRVEGRLAAMEEALRRVEGSANVEHRTLNIEHRREEGGGAVLGGGMGAVGGNANVEHRTSNIEHRREEGGGAMVGSGAGAVGGSANVEHRTSNIEHRSGEGRAAVLPPPLPKRIPAHIAAPSVAPRAEAGRGQWEEWVGRNWTSWVGAIVVVLGVCFFLKYAWDAGWLALSPTARVWMAIGAGVALAGAGEWVGRRAMAVLSATLCGAGVAVGMAACFAAATLFDTPVFSLNGAMAGVALCAVAGIGLGLHVNGVSVAIIAMLGAYAAPAILSTGADRSVELMFYLGAVAVVAWGLAYLKGGKWGSVRWVAWTCTVLWMALWLLRFGLRAEHSVLAMGAIAFFFLGFAGEAYATLVRDAKPYDEDEAAGGPHPNPLPTAGIVIGGSNWARGREREPVDGLDASLAVLLMMSCAAAFAGFYAVLNQFGAGTGLLAMRPAAAFALGMAALHALIGLGSPGRQFGRSGWLCAAALLTLAVPLALGQFAVTLGWLLMAGGLAVLSRGGGRRAVSVWAVVLFGLAVAKLFTLDLLNRRLGGVVLAFEGQKVTRWMVLAWGVASMGHGMGWVLGGWRLGSESGRAQVGQRVPFGMGLVMAAVGTVVFIAGAAMGWEGQWLNMLVLAWTLGMVILGGRVPQSGYLVQAAILLVLVSVNWAGVEGVRRVVENWRGEAAPQAPLFNLSTVVGVALLGMIWWLGRSAGEQSKVAAGVGGGVILFALLTFQTLTGMDWFSNSFADVGTAKQVALSVLWGVLGLAAVVVGFAAEVRGLRYAGLGLLAVTLGKILVLDMASVRQVYRILSFLAVGGLLLCVSFVYHRHTVSRKALEENRGDAGGTPM